MARKPAQERGRWPQDEEFRSQDCDRAVAPAIVPLDAPSTSMRLSAAASPAKIVAAETSPPRQHSANKGKSVTLARRSH
jgi:hypothetical protein